MNPFWPLQWLFSTDGFIPLRQQPGWTVTMVNANLLSNGFMFLFLASLALLLLAFRRTPGRQPLLFRDATVATWFSYALLALSATFLARALMIGYPAYRLLVLTNIIAAIAGWLAVSVAMPVALRRRVEQQREERHEFANKAQSFELRVAANIHRLEKLQEAMRQSNQVLEQMVTSIEHISQLPASGKPGDP